MYLWLYIGFDVRLLKGTFLSLLKLFALLSPFVIKLVMKASIDYIPAVTSHFVCKVCERDTFVLFYCLPDCEFLGSICWDCFMDYIPGVSSYLLCKVFKGETTCPFSFYGLIVAFPVTWLPLQP